MTTPIQMIFFFLFFFSYQQLHQLILGKRKKKSALEHVHVCDGHGRRFQT